MVGGHSVDPIQEGCSLTWIRGGGVGTSRIFSLGLFYFLAGNLSPFLFPKGYSTANGRPIVINREEILQPIYLLLAHARVSGNSWNQEIRGLDLLE